MGPYNGFSHILLVSHQIFDRCYVVVTLWDTFLFTQKKQKNKNKNKNKNKKIGPVDFSLISINKNLGGCGGNMFCP